MTTPHQARPSWTVVVVLLVLVASSALLLPVVPWPRDHWFETQYLIFGSHVGTDNYSPIAAPAFLYGGIHWIASAVNLSLRRELYFASIVQNGLLFCSALMIYAALRELRLPLAGLISVGLLCWTVSTGLPQTFNSENACFFLTSALLFASVRLYSGETNRFLAATLLVAASTGLLVLTRMIPLLFVPGLTWLLSKRLTGKQLLTFGGAVSLLTASMLLWLVWTNHDRFGRYELTNSNGRHLWQGAKEIASRALSGVPEYEALRKIAPGIDGAPNRFLPFNRGLDFWDVPYPDQVPGLGRFQRSDVTRDGQKDALLKALALEAIRSKPILYLASGAHKFLQTVGEAPYQLGFVSGIDGFYNPLGLSEPLPPLSNATGLIPRDVTDAFRTLLDFIYRMGHVLYPIGICLVSTSLVAMSAVTYRIRNPHVKQRLQRRPLDIGGSRRLHTLVFAIGVAIAGIVCLAPALTFGSYVAFALSTAMVIAQMRVLAKFDRQRAAGIAFDVRLPHRRLYCCLAILFFGSLWLSWQVEVPLSRYAVPYLPLLILLLSMALAFWRALSEEMRLHASA